MKDIASRTVIIVAAIALGGWAVWDTSRYKIGVDLAGGTILEYKIKEDPDRRGAPPDMGELTVALKKRLDPSGLKNYVIRGLGAERIEIIMPRADMSDVDLVKRTISTVGQLRFRIVADNRRHRLEIDLARQQWEANRAKRVVERDTVLAEFIPYGMYKPTTKEELKKQAEKLAWPEKKTLNETVRFVAVASLPDYPEKDSEFLTRVEAGQKFVLAVFDNEDLDFNGADNLTVIDDDGIRYVLMASDQYNVVGDYLTEIREDVDQRRGEPALAFNFNAVGADKFGRLTDEYKPDRDGKRFRLGVVLDNRLRSAPTVEGRIDFRGIISGRFTTREVQALKKIFAAGKLPHAIEHQPEREFQINPTLGEDTIRNGRISITLSLAVVLLFMSWYYKWAGLIAVLALTLNLLFTVALMVVLQATWTLPGLAGLVLTIGMSVDANVLIFERMREEMDRGASFATAIRLGYERAWTTIVDTNSTSVLTAFILFTIGTDQVKGFAVTLILGIVTGIFTSVFVTRTIFDFLYARRILRHLEMRRFLSKPNINFLQYTRVCAAISLTVIAIGVMAFAARGVNNFDVEFTGGTMAGLRFNQSLDTASVRRLAADGGVHDPQVEQGALGGEEAGRYFVIRTVEKDRGAENNVRRKLADAFSKYLYKTQMQASPVEKIPTTPANAPAPPAGDKVAAMLRNYAGGEAVTLAVESPKPVAFFRGKFDDLLRAKDPTATSSALLIGIEPVGEPRNYKVGGRTITGYTQFRVAASSGLASLVADMHSYLDKNPDFEQYSQFGPQVAGRTQTQAAMAIFLSWLLIIAYVGFRFNNLAFGLGGVVALVHDVLVSVGLTAIVSTLGVMFPFLGYVLITDMKMNLDMVAAVLTLIGYSVHDTIVIFDRVREIRGKSPRLTSEMFNRAVNETLSRTIITSVLTWLAVFILFLGGGQALRGFAFLMTVGLIAGTYSTVYIASPVVLWIARLQEGRQRKRGSAGAASKAQPVGEAT